MVKFIINDYFYDFKFLNGVFFKVNKNNNYVITSLYVFMLIYFTSFNEIHCFYYLFTNFILKQDLHKIIK